MSKLGEGDNQNMLVTLDEADDRRVVGTDSPGGHSKMVVDKVDQFLAGSELSLFA